MPSNKNFIEKHLQQQQNGKKKINFKCYQWIKKQQQQQNVCKRSLFQRQRQRNSKNFQINLSVLKRC